MRRDGGGRQKRWEGRERLWIGVGNNEREER